MLGALFGLSLFLLLTAVVSQALVDPVLGADGGRRLLRRRTTPRRSPSRRPLGMLAVNLGIATLIPISWVLMMVVHQVRPRWLSLGAARDPVALPARLPGDRAWWR